MAQVANQKHIAISLEKTRGSAFQNNRWGARHVDAWKAPRGPERGIVAVITGLALMADSYQEQNASPIGDDGVLGPAWLDIARGVNTMLNGELGRLDGGTLSGLLNALKDEAGFGDEEL